jgi:hypothetical protein
MSLLYKLRNSIGLLVMCSGDQPKLKPDIPYDINHCYDWLTGTIDNYQTEENAILKQILSPYTMNKLAENDWSYYQFN